MSLTSALNTAQSIFNNTGTQSSIVSNNISNAGNKDYVRRQAMLTTSLGGAQVVKISRAQEDALLKQYLKASSQDSAQQTLLGGLEDLKSIMGGNENETSPETALRAFRDKLGTFRATPGVHIGDIHDEANLVGRLRIDEGANVRAADRFENFLATG